MDRPRRTIEQAYHEGAPGLPLIVLIHGMGMNVTFWTAPGEARILGGMYPLSALLNGHEELPTVYDVFRADGYSLLAWTQARPTGPMTVAVQELAALMEQHRRPAAQGVIFICHSRGGLIARKYLEQAAVPLRALITVATPHRGTTMARWAVYAAPAAGAVRTLLAGLSRNEVDSAFRRVLRFFNSKGIRELLPGSSFFAGLRDRKDPEARYLSIGGTNPDLLRALSLPMLMSRIIPDRILPVEMRPGCGDGLVSAASSVMPDGDGHLDIPANHAALLFHPSVRDYIIEAVRSLDT